MISISLFYYCKNVFIHLDDWEKINEVSLPEKENFCSHINLENITDADYALPKRVCKDFEIKNFGEYHDFHVQSDTYFQKMYFEIYDARFLTTPGLTWQAAFKKTKVKLDLLTEIDMLIMVEKVLETEYVMLFIDMPELIANA